MILVTLILNLLLACSCNSHSFLCQYDSSLGFGVCLDCMHNTKGHKCESCNTAFYRNPSTGITDVNACIGMCYTRRFIHFLKLYFLIHFFLG